MHRFDGRVAARTVTQSNFALNQRPAASVPGPALRSWLRFIFPSWDRLPILSFDGFSHLHFNFIPFVFCAT